MKVSKKDLAGRIRRRITLQEFEESYENLARRKYGEDAPIIPVFSLTDDQIIRRYANREELNLLTK